MIVRRHQIPLVGQRIRQLRKDRSLTQSELAAKIGIQQSDLCRMETGEYKVSLEALFKILKIFEMNIAEFFLLTAPGEITADEHAALTLYRALTPPGKEDAKEFMRFTGRRERRPRRSGRGNAKSRPRPRAV